MAAMGCACFAERNLEDCFSEDCFGVGGCTEVSGDLREFCVALGIFVLFYSYLWIVGIS